MKALLIYAAIGVVVAIALDLRQRDRSPTTRLSSFALALAAWPLWGPVSWLQAPTLGSVDTSLVTRCRQALAEARAAVQGTALDGLLPERLTTQLLSGLSQVQARHAELTNLLARPEFRAQTADDGLPGEGGRHAKRAREDNLRRLHELRARDERLLDEITELAEALRTQLLVARFTGNSNDPGSAVGDLLTALSARVESMDAWFELDNGRPGVNTAV